MIADFCSTCNFMRSDNNKSFDPKWLGDPDLTVAGYYGGTDENEKELYFHGLGLQRSGTYDKAVKCYDEAIRLNNQDMRLCAYAWYNRALALHSLGKYREAVDSYIKSKATNFDREGFYFEALLAYGQARSNVMNGDIKEGLIFLQTATYIFNSMGMREVFLRLVESDPSFDDIRESNYFRSMTNNG